MVRVANAVLRGCGMQLGSRTQQDRRKHGGACGFADDVAGPPYNGMISAGNNFLFKSGAGCGSCYQVKCTGDPACSGNPVSVTITDECPGCNGAPVHFDLSGKAIGALAKPGQDDKLRSLGKINIQYQRIRCSYSTPITFKIDKGSTPNYMSFAIEDVNGDGDIGAVQISSPSSKGWLNMQRVWGVTWKVNLSNGIGGPFSVKVTTIESKVTYIANNVIPANWQPGQHYHG
ncbi:Putative expansin-B2 [Striga hermonthica]|uniref:Expansin-B2 n=1 Tax=Striga hermonthica TaxID=68872 RepID=A0A9N7MT29_STRHE|nr:Putative expansin-B2 [Striga hermonthica]